MAGAASIAGRGARARRPRAPGTFGLSLVCLAAGAALAAGWWTHTELYLVPDAGLGYGLGILGLALMATLPLYSLRKRAGFMQSWGPLRAWFQPHMAIGVLGPLAILFHCNFSLGSLNSNVALVCMLVVAGSGFVGRFLYVRIHCALTGRRQSFEELAREARAGGGVLAEALAASPRLAGELQRFERFALTPRTSLTSEVSRLLQLGRRARATRRAARRLLRRAAAARAAGVPRGRRARVRALDRAIREQLRAMRRVASFTAYERLFALWHALHVPLCILLFTSAAVHVLAVHMY